MDIVGGAFLRLWFLGSITVVAALAAVTWALLRFADLNRPATRVPCGSRPFRCQRAIVGDVKGVLSVPAVSGPRRRERTPMPVRWVPVAGRVLGLLAAAM